MTTGGYSPSREQMAAIVSAARYLHRIVGAWRRDSNLPGYPVEMGNVTALEALFGLEIALNPQRLSWGDRRRTGLEVRCWPAEVGVGVAWLRNLTDLILEHHRLQAFARIPRWEPVADVAPQVISIADDEFRALRRAIGKLPPLRSLPELDAPPPVIAAVSRPDVEMTDESTPPVLLIKPTSPPLVFGRPKPPLTLQQFRVVKAMIDAGPGGLKLAALKNRCGGDPVNVLKRLAKGDPDWRAAIILPGSSRNGYRLDFSARDGRSIRVHSASAQ